MQFDMLEIAEVIHEIEAIPGGHDHDIKGRRAENNAGANESYTKEAQKLEQGMDEFGEIAEFICLSNKKEFCAIVLEDFSTRPEPGSRGATSAHG